MLSGSLWFPVGMATFVMVLQPYFSARTWFLSALLTGWAFADWMRHDACRREIPLPRVSRALCFFGWPLIIPGYAFFSRSGRERWQWFAFAFGWLVLVVFAITLFSRRA